MTFSSRRKRPTTVRWPRTPGTTTNLRRAAVGLFVGTIGVSLAVAQSPNTPSEAEARTPTVTVFYEKLPSGEIRPVSNQPQPSQQPKQVSKSVPVTTLQPMALPTPRSQIKSVSVHPQFLAPLPAPKMASRSVPVSVQSSSLPTTPQMMTWSANQRPVRMAPTQSSQPQTISFHRMPDGSIVMRPILSPPPIPEEPILAKTQPTDALNTATAITQPVAPESNQPVVVAAPIVPQLESMQVVVQHHVIQTPIEAPKPVDPPAVVPEPVVVKAPVIECKPPAPIAPIKSEPASVVALPAPAVIAEPECKIEPIVIEPPTAVKNNCPPAPIVPSAPIATEKKAEVVEITADTPPTPVVPEGTAPAEKKAEVVTAKVAESVNSAIVETPKPIENKQPEVEKPQVVIRILPAPTQAPHYKPTPLPQPAVVVAAPAPVAPAPQFTSKITSQAGAEPASPVKRDVDTVKMKPVERTPEPVLVPVVAQEPVTLPPSLPDPVPTIPTNALPTNVAPTYTNIATAMQQPTTDGLMQDILTTLSDYGIETNPPAPSRLYRLESEAQLKRRIADEIKRRPVKQGEQPETVVTFPKYEPLSDEPYQERQFGGLIKQIEPNYVCYHRLYAEEVNSERYGWDLGPIQPIVSSLYAFKDFALMPYNFGVRPHQRYDCGAGHCYPGDPVPYLIYPLEKSATGAGMEAAAIIALFCLLP